MLHALRTPGAERQLRTRPCCAVLHVDVIEARVLEALHKRTRPDQIDGYCDMGVNRHLDDAGGQKSSALDAVALPRGEHPQGSSTVKRL
jgi:hypothetical protein